MSNAEIIADLNRAKALFQLRAVTAALGLTPLPPHPQKTVGHEDREGEAGSNHVEGK